jgi:F-type H+-transporting ATPase subunit a
VSKLIKWVIYIAVFVGLCSLAGALGKLGNFPTITLPAEPVPGLAIGGFSITNTLIATLIADVIIILFAVAATRRIRKGTPDADVPRGAQNLFEIIIDLLYGLCVNVAGKQAKRIFPIMATIFLFVLFANWMELIPGMDSVGVIEPAHGDIKGYAPRELIPGVLYTVDNSQPVEHPSEAAPEGESQGEEGVCESCAITAFARTATSDINTSLALALVTMTLVQYFGAKALGVRYFSKFINIPALRKGGMGVMLFVVGFLELISEISRILSFTFRLLGNIFAGGVLLFVMTSLIPFIVPVPFYILEVFVGFIQALVFSMLALVFINMAMASHDEHASEHH